MLVRFIFLILWNILLTDFCVLGLFEQCNHQVDLKAGQKIYINSPYYPGDYPIGTSCRYAVQAPEDHQLKFTCDIQLNVPTNAPLCQNEAFFFNKEGSEVLSDSDSFCSQHKIERKSFLNRAVISYISKPLYNKNLPPIILKDVEEAENEDQKTSNPQNDKDNQNKSENIISNTTNLDPPDLDLRGEGFENAFAYLAELLTNNATPTMELEEANETFLSDFKIPEISWRKSEKSSAKRRPISNKKRGRIVNTDLAENQFFGYIDNRGGGRFSCLVEVVEPSCDCGWSISLKIAGDAELAGIDEFPSMAGVKTIANDKIFCGATIIHHRYLLSAAHCFVSPQTNRSDLIRVVVGENDVTTILESLYTRAYEIQSILLHELFYSSSRTLRNDIALLRTRLPIEWNRSVGPACLPFLTVSSPGSNKPRKPPLPGEKLETAGWGTTSFGGAQSTRLRKTTLDMLPTNRCRQILRSVPPGSFCTFTPGQDTCQYDSGGALYARHDRLFAVGIVSYGFACATQQPSVNTRVASFIKWIKAKTPDASYCVKSF